MQTHRYLICGLRGQKIQYNKTNCKSKLTAQVTLLWINSKTAGELVKDPPAQCMRCKRCRFNPWVRKTPGLGNGNLLQYSCLENSMGRGIWQATRSCKESDITVCYFKSMSNSKQFGPGLYENYPGFFQGQSS